jgi:hypothetical protein
MGAGGSGARIMGVEGRNDGGNELFVGLGECESAPMLLYPRCRAYCFIASFSR